ncbi:MAG: CHAP domain-containing protein [Nonomuraea sp.]|nr:CHAP domain-containing protein [Nonomuraea sp.]
MAKHRLTRAPKINYARAAIGLTVVASAFGAHTAANADTTPSIEKQAQANVKQAALAAPAKPAPHNALPKRVTAAQVLSLATQQVGVREDSAGGGTKFQKWYMNSQRAGETVKRDGGNRQMYLNAAWCSMFVSWVGEELGVRPTVGWDAYTVTHAKWFKNNKRWGTTAKPGSVVFFSWNGSKSLDAIQHVGFVIKDNGNGTIKTVEGNTGNGEVEERTRPKSQVVGYGYPDYAATA